LGRLTDLDDAIHDLLSDAEYATDEEKCEEYIDSAKLAIQKATRAIRRKLAASVADASLAQSTPETTTPAAVTHSVKLPPTRLQPFSGDVETWSRGRFLEASDERIPPGVEKFSRSSGSTQKNSPISELETSFSCMKTFDRDTYRRKHGEELRERRDGKVRTVVLRASDRKRITRPVQLDIPLETDQVGEDVED
jgi:hypothetical protein